MTDPERRHSAEPAEGDEPGADPGDAADGGRTPHPQDPAEGADDAAGGADAPGA